MRGSQQCGAVRRGTLIRLLRLPLGGIVTDLPGNRGQPMGLNVFTLFTGLGLGSLLFQDALTWGFPLAFTTFGAAALIAAAVAVPLRGFAVRWRAWWLVGQWPVVRGAGLGCRSASMRCQDLRAAMRTGPHSGENGGA